MGRASQRKRQNVYLTTGKVAVRTCPICKEALDGATAISFEKPAPQEPLVLPDGAITVCAYCATILMAEAGGFRLVTAAEFAELDPLQQKILGVYTTMKTTKGKTS